MIVSTNLAYRSPLCQAVGRAYACTYVDHSYSAIQVPTAQVIVLGTTTTSTVRASSGE